MGVSQHKKYARLLAAVQEMSPRPSSSFPFSGREKAGPEGAAEVEPKQKKNTRMKKMFILSLTQVQGCQPPTSSNIKDL